MPVSLHWFLPTSGDSRTDLSLGNAVGARGSRVNGNGAGAAGDGAGGGAAGGGHHRPPDVDYLAQIASAAEHLGFAGALTPTSSWCEDAWITTAALSQRTRTFRFLVAFRPGLLSPTLAAQMAATYQRISGGRLLLNVVVGGDDVEQRRFGDHLDKDARYARAGEFLDVVRRLWDGGPVDHDGEHITVADARLIPHPVRPRVYLGGSSDPAIEVAARHADVYLTWGEPPDQVAEKLDRVRDRAAAHGRDGDVRFGIRLHAIARDTTAGAWAEARRLLDGLDPARIAAAQRVQAASQSEGQRRMAALHGGRTDALEVAPNLWAGIGLVRGGAGTALVGSHEEVADRIAEYHALGIDELVLSGYPHLEEAYRVGEGVIPVLRRRGLLADAFPPPAGPVARSPGAAPGSPAPA
jgi:alkanesulfonate monooxygenase